MFQLKDFEKRIHIIEVGLKWTGTTHKTDFFLLKQVGIVSIPIYLNVRIVVQKHTVTKCWRKPMKSIIQTDRDRCFLCGRVRSFGNPLDDHHVFFGPNRNLSEKYGLKVFLCHTGCHTFGRNSVHECAEVNHELQRTVQRFAMNYYGWSTEDFIRLFGKSYLSGD